MSILDAPYFHDEAKAFEQLESLMWPNGPECPHCGVVNDANPIPVNTAKKVRHGLYRCNAKECRKQFTVTVATIFESSHIPLHKWLQAAYLMCSSKKGVSSLQIQRMLDLKSYRSALFMTHRLRAAMDPIYDAPGTPMGGASKVVEADETYIGVRKGATKKAAFHHKNTVFAMVERGGDVRSFHIDGATKEGIKWIVDRNLDKQSVLYTDGAGWYQNNNMETAAHDWVDHGREEYVRGDVHTNTIEGFFSVFKRGMKGVYQHCSEKHLHRYLAEFDFRYNNRIAAGVDDVTRTANALKGARGKRLTYRLHGDKEIFKQT